MRPAVVLINFLILLFFDSHAQNIPTLMMDVNWNTGSISLENGHQLRGWVKYNDKLRVVAYQPFYNKDISNVFREDDITAVELYDNASVDSRKLYSLAFINEVTGQEESLLFEVLKEFKHFAILSRKDPIHAAHTFRKGSPIGFIYEFPFKYSFNSNGVPFTVQTETIYITDDKGEWNPYCKQFMYDGTSGKGKGKMIDKKLLERYIPHAHYTQLQKYARAHKLQFKHKQDLLTILDYYEELLYNEDAINE